MANLPPPSALAERWLAATGIFTPGEFLGNNGEEGEEEEEEEKRFLGEEGSGKKERPTEC